ncbi:hypothetical protein [Streptomyces sp. ST2-7A]|uniref:hypothetical protein n=1 Tax=Streptomyces sp. ST2-7A TaxID=2907214 RepID=UPI001F16AAC1|nr:hypothetical protein [Streptomyces sp. ST2-7A]MCE7080397.1 hypothetical protein [Streptomyces sp. ST2-7A]
MAEVTRLSTLVELDGERPNPEEMAVSARLEAVLSDGRRVPLLDDRGWAESTHGGGADIREFVSVGEIEETARTVVGPDEPGEGGTHEEMAADHWGHLTDILRRGGVAADPAELEHLPHEVVLGERLREWLGRARPSPPGPAPTGGDQPGSAGPK